jgi:indolepyruvate ferredoxin oxidoreductase beta subunit
MEHNRGTKSILLAGVGGQGILRASDILCQVLMDVGLDAKKSEVHGMAQRGGCVTSHVRYGQKVHSPIAQKGDVDILLSFEKCESLRYLDYMKRDGVIIINNAEIYPPSVNLGEVIYPQSVYDLVSVIFKKVKIVDAYEMAVRTGNVRTENTVLLGALSLYLPIEPVVWERVLRENFPPKVVEANIMAFQLGRVT